MQALELMLCDEKANSMRMLEYYTYDGINAGQVLLVMRFTAVGRDINLEEYYRLDAEHTSRVAH